MAGDCNEIIYKVPSSPNRSVILCVPQDEWECWHEGSAAVWKMALGRMLLSVAVRYTGPWRTSRNSAAAGSIEWIM